MPMNAHLHLNTSKEELEKLPTRQLMMLRKSAFSVTHKCSCPTHCGDDVLTQEEQDYNQRVYALRRRIAEILPHREHVPNKIEAKAARQARAKNRP